MLHREYKAFGSQCLPGSPCPAVPCSGGESGLERFLVLRIAGPEGGGQACASMGASALFTLGPLSV